MNKAATLSLVSIWFRGSGCELLRNKIFTYSGFRNPKKGPPSQAALAVPRQITADSAAKHQGRGSQQKACARREQWSAQLLQRSASQVLLASRKLPPKPAA